MTHEIHLPRSFCSPRFAYFMKQKAIATLVVTLLLGCSASRKAYRAPQAPPDLTAAGIRSAREVKLTTLAGRQTNLAEHSADVTFIAFWETACPPCLVELPQIDRLFQEYRADPKVSILAVNIDEPDQRAKVAEMVRELKLSLPVLLDPEQELIIRFGDIAMPTQVVIDQSSKVLLEVGFNTMFRLMNDPTLGFIMDWVVEFQAENRHLIELAKAGALPDERPIISRPEVKEVPAGAVLRIRLPKGMSMNPNFESAFRTTLGNIFPRANAAQLDRFMAKVDESARTGEQVTLTAP